VQAGEVEDVMPDGSGFWIKLDGIHQRRYVRVDDPAY
jgi:hypothetical protein